MWLQSLMFVRWLNCCQRAALRRFNGAKLALLPKQNKNFKQNQNSMSKLKAYIAGRIQGEDPEVVRSQFSQKQKELEALGYEVINPFLRIMSVNIARTGLGMEPLKDDLNRKEIMGICLYDISQCDELHLLPDWAESPGAVMECDFADKMNMKIVYNIK